MLNIKSLDLRSDAAENSIMQTITIAVSAILIAAGLVTAPGLINNARDNNATTDLANIAYAEEFNLANTGNYGSLAQIKTSTDQSIAEGGSGPKLTLSGGVSTAVASNNTTYKLYALSKSGKLFVRDSSSAATVRVNGAAAGDDYKFKITAGKLVADGTATVPTDAAALTFTTN
jgi:hypothetical protein